MLCATLVQIVLAVDATGLRSKAAEIYRALESPRTRIHLDTSSLPDRIEGPSGSVGWRLDRDGGNRPSGTEILVPRWEGPDGAPLSSHRIAVRLSRKEWTPYAKGRMERGTPGDSSALRWEWTESSARLAPPPDPTALPSFRLRTGAGMDQPLRMDRWEPVPAVTPGQKLIVTSQQSGARVSIEGTAQGNAVVGGTVRVRTAFGRKILCRIQPDGSALALD